MKTKFTLLAALAGLLTLNAGAQENPGRPGGPGGRGGEGRGRPQPPTAEEIKKYDKDGDGQLSREEYRPLMEERRKELEKKYDANGDGKLDDEERRKLESENPRRGPGGPGAPGAAGVPGGPPPTAEEIKTHDKNSDGKLEGEEVTALREARRKARMEKYDADKNGELSDEERAKMMEDIRRERGGRTAPEGRGRRGSAPPDSKPEEKKIPVPETK